jgi:hypothetical protein
MRCGISSCRRLPTRRGLSIILVVVILTVLIAFVSLAVDVGRIRLARAQLQTDADAAARAGAWELPPSKSTQDVIDQTLEAAAKNVVIDNDDQSNARTNPDMELNAQEDIEFGIWDEKQKNFTPIVDQHNTDTDERRLANAVRAHARRLEERDNPVKLIFAPIVGVFDKDIERQATAYVTGESSVNYGFVGIDGVLATGNFATLNGSVISDGNISLGNSDVNGDARPGIGKDITQRPNSTVTGWMADLTYSVKSLYPVLNTAPASALPIPTNLQFLGGVSPAKRVEYKGTWNNNNNDITVNGYVRIYIEDVTAKTKGNLDLTSLKVVWQNPTTPNANRLEFYVVGTKVKTINCAGNRQSWYHIYAPQCDISIEGTADYFGWAIGKTLTWKGTATYNYDGTLNTQPVHAVQLHLVQ